MEFRILGPLEVRGGDGVLPLGGARQRALLAMLLMHANEPVNADRLATALWGEEVPADAVGTVRVYVSRLRRALGSADVLETTPAGYRLRVGPGELDSDRFGALADEGRRALADGDADRAGRLLRDALALWRGPPLGDQAFAAFAQGAIARLEEQRLAALETRVEADLAAGRHGELVAELQELVERHPLRERLCGQLMLALYRSGRQAEALAAYRAARAALVETIGVEPDPALRDLHEAILRQDPSLALARPAARLPPELDAAAATPLAGRAEELGRLRALWAVGGGALVVVTGADGAGKTRLAAALAEEVAGTGAPVFYVAGAAPGATGTAAGATDTAPGATGTAPGASGTTTGATGTTTGATGTAADATGTGAGTGAASTGTAAGAALGVVAAARDSARRALLVVDDLDRGGPELRAAVAGLDDVFVLATARDAAAVADLAPAASIALGPLGLDAVREIAAYHAGDAVDAATARGLADAAGGVPARVHELAGEWARSAAERRVEAAADRVATERGAWRGAEHALTDEVIELRAVRERAGRAGRAAGPAVDVCPYKGLAAFGFEDAEFYFGRERLVAELVARTVGSPLLAVVGPSGSGKSSVLRAGLLPALAGGALPGSEGWSQVVLRPGEHPRRELHRATRNVSPGDRVVLAVDQFEELFTLCRDEEERAAFVGELVRRARGRDGRWTVLLTVRADLYGRTAAHPELAELVAMNHVVVGPMRRDELRRAIELPAERAGLHVERALVDVLLADVEAQPGALPLLSTALLALWQQRDSTWLRLSAYEGSGGVRRAVAGLAEEVYGRLDEDGRRVARRVLPRLVRDGGDGALVRRRVALDELGEHGRDVVSRLADQRLLTVSAGTVELAHEALLQEWPRLRGWLEEDAAGRRVQRQLEQAAADWDAEGRDDAQLYRGARLASALEWRAASPEALTPAQTEFLEASRTAGDRAQRRLRAGFAGVSALLVLAVIAALVALDQRSAARDRALTADAQRLGAEAQAADRLDRALLLARQGVALQDSPNTRDSLLTALLRTPAAIGVLPAPGAQPGVVALHPDGRLLAVGRRDGRVEFYDPVTRRRAGRPNGPGGRYPVLGLAFSPDGDTLAVARDDREDGVVDLLDVRTRRRVGRVDHTLLDVLLIRLWFSPDSRTLVVGPEYQPAGATFEILRVDARSGRELDEVVIGELDARMLGFLDGGRRIVTSAGATTELRDASTRRVLRRFPGASVWAEASPGEQTLALFAENGSLRFLDLASGRMREAPGGHHARVSAERFSPDGQTLVSGGGDGRLLVWDVRRAAVAETLEDRLNGAILDVAITRDAATAYTTSSDGTVTAWDLAGTRRFARLLQAGGRRLVPGPLAVTPNGRVAVPDDQGGVDVIDTRTARLVARLRAGARRDLVAAALAPDGRTGAAVTAAGDLGFWDVRSGRLLAPLQHAHGRTFVTRLAFSADGRRLVSGGNDAIVRLWDVRRRTTAERTSLSDNLDLSLSPDGRLLAAVRASSSFGGGLHILSVPGLQMVRGPRAPPGTVARFSRDGRSLVYGDLEGRVWIYDTRTWRPRGDPLQGSRVAVTAADVSPDGRLLAATWDDGTARLWDVRTRHPIGGVLFNANGNWLETAFAGPARLVIAGTAGGIGMVLDLRQGAWERHACAVAGRRLTRAEWREVLPGRDYAPAC